MGIIKVLKEYTKEIGYTCLALTAGYIVIIYGSVLSASITSWGQKLNTMTYSNKAENKGQLLALKLQYCQGNLYPSDQTRIAAEINKILQIDPNLIKEISENSLETGLIISKINNGEYKCPNVK